MNEPLRILLISGVSAIAGLTLFYAIVGVLCLHSTKPTQTLGNCVTEANTVWCRTEAR